MRLRLGLIRSDGVCSLDKVLSFPRRQIGANVSRSQQASSPEDKPLVNIGGLLDS